MPCVYMHVDANEAAIIQNDDTSQAACLTRAVSAYGYMRICVFLSRLPPPVLLWCLSSPKAFGKLHLRSVSVLARKPKRLVRAAHRACRRDTTRLILCCVMIIILEQSQDDDLNILLSAIASESRLPMHEIWRTLKQRAYESHCTSSTSLKLPLNLHLVVKKSIPPK